MYEPTTALVEGSKKKTVERFLLLQARTVARHDWDCSSVIHNHLSIGATDTALTTTGTATAKSTKTAAEA